MKKQLDIVTNTFTPNDWERAPSVQFSPYQLKRTHISWDVGSCFGSRQIHNDSNLQLIEAKISAAISVLTKYSEDYVAINKLTQTKSNSVLKKGS